MPQSSEIDGIVFFAHVGSGGLFFCHERFEIERISQQGCHRGVHEIFFCQEHA